jgi:hypothetical protein
VIRAGAIIAALLIALVTGIVVSHRQTAGHADPASVVLQVRRLNELATVKYTVQKVVGIREPKYPVGEESILLVIQASVVAGVDLETLRPGDVDVKRDGSVRVKVPPAKILSVSVDEKETKVWDRRKTWWTPWVPFSRDLEQRARVQGIEAARAAAIEMGILRQAQQNAEASIQSLLQLTGARNVEVVRTGAS